MTVLSPLWLLPAIACLAAAFVWRMPAGTDSWRAVLGADVLAFLRPEAGRASRINPALLAAAIGFSALATPAMHDENINAYRHAEGWLVMADVSKSMTLDDIRPTRLAAARAIATGLADAAGARATGLVIYAGDAYLAEPFAFDRRQFAALAGSLEPGIIPVEGSDVARAFSFGASLISDSTISRARIFLLTDSGGITANAIATVTQFAAKGHRVDVIVIADPQTQSPVATDMDAAQRLAEAGGGTMIAADALGAVDLTQLDPDATTGTALTSLDLKAIGWASLAHWLLLGAIPLMLILFARRLA